MTRHVGSITIIEKEPPQQCDMCGEIDELRPYGPDGSCICFPCSETLPPEEVKTRMHAYLFPT